VSEKPPDEEIVSPELILVSGGDEARRARERLPEFPGFRARVEAAPERPAPPSYPEIAYDERLAERPRRRRRRVVLGLALAGAGVAAGAYAGNAHWRAGAAVDAAATPPPVATTQRASTTQPAATVPSAVAPLDPAPAAPTPARTTAPPTAPAATTAATPPATTAPAPPTTTAAAPRKQASATRGFVPARTWIWVAGPGTKAYDVTFRLGGRVVLEARATQPRFVLPASFRFRAGRYRWTVRPLPLDPTKAPLVDSHFTLTAATAAAANAGR